MRWKKLGASTSLDTANKTLYFTNVKCYYHDQLIIQSKFGMVYVIYICDMFSPIILIKQINI